MSDIAKQLADKARQSGAVREQSEFFSVTDKKKVDAGGGNMVDVEVPNGTHRVKILSEKIGMGKSFNGEEQQQFQLTILDNGKEKQWHMPVKNEKGELYYLIEDLESIEIGEEFMVEAVKMKNGKYAKRISKVVGTHPTHDTASPEDLPIISLDEDISPEDVPF
jgi:hypothetical protein